MSKVNLGKGEGFEGGAGFPDGRLDLLFQELLHEHAKERPGLLQYLTTQNKQTNKQETCKHATQLYHTILKTKGVSVFKLSLHLKEAG